jgi:SOS response regulatory protein OraA/RecX
MAEEYKRRMVNYFKKNLTKGYTPDSLKFALMSQGYSRAIVESAIEQANKELAEKAPVLKEKPVIKYEIIDEYDKPIKIKKSWWKRLLGL